MYMQMQMRVRSQDVNTAAETAAGTAVMVSAPPAAREHARASTAPNTNTDNIYR